MEEYEVIRWGRGLYCAKGKGDLTSAKFQHLVADRISALARQDNPRKIGLCYDALEVLSFEPDLHRGGVKYPDQVRRRIVATAVLSDSPVIRFATGASAVILRRKMKVFRTQKEALDWLKEVISGDRSQTLSRRKTAPDREPSEKKAAL